MSFLRTQLMNNYFSIISFDRARDFYYILFRNDKRQVAALKVLRPPNLFQPYNYTEVNRYPAIYNFIKSYYTHRRDISILSFGCSTGEELLDLDEYFNPSRILGIDINKSNIAECKKKLLRHGKLNIECIVNAYPPEKGGNCFDMVFAMAVFRHGNLNNGPPTCKPYLYFENYENTVNMFSDIIKPGGLLILTHSNFRFIDTTASEAFRAVFSLNESTGLLNFPLYDRNNTLLSCPYYSDVVFEKIR